MRTSFYADNVFYEDDADARYDFGRRTTLLAPKLPCGRTVRARTWTTLAMGGVIFVAGIVFGASAFRPQPKPLRNWNDLLERVAKRMAPDLDLTEQQQQRIEKILRAHQPHLNQIHARTIADMRTELQQVIEETSAVLTLEQDVRFRAKAEHDLDLNFPATGRSAADRNSAGPVVLKPEPI